MKVLKLKFLFLILASFVLIYSCEKDNIMSQIEEAPKENIKLSHPVIFTVGDQEITLREGETTAKYTKTELGNIQNNPYKVANIKQAFENIKGVTITTVAPTHLQVKFTPTSLEDLDKLTTSDAFLFDFPLDKEITKMGDYYQELELGEYPILYSTVSADFNFPNVDYEILEELFVSPYETSLTAEAFRLTGNTYISPFDDNIEDETELNGFADDCQPGCASFPCCLGGEVACDDDNLPNPDDCPFYDVTCFDNSNTLAEYLACVEAVIIAANNNSLYEINSCGCEVYKDIRKPGGCVNVEDTELTVAMQPVRRVKVIMWDKWITDHHSTYTDDNGCWKINDRFFGRAWMWIKFSNSRGKIRGAKDKNFNSLWLWKKTVKDYVGKIWGPYFNNIAVNYMQVIDNTSNNHRYWSAATVNNALHEFHDYANLDGISPPPDGLDIYIARKQRFGYAFMPHFMGSQLTAYALGDGLDGNSWAISPFGLLLSIFTPATIATQLFPDVLIGTNYQNSDRLKSLAYHEFAHASHYSQVGNLYWAELVAAEVAADGHGDEFSDDAELIGLVESWADYIGGHNFVHRTYNNTNSIFGNWERRVERTWNEVNNHVPVGLHHDLADIGEPLWNNGTPSNPVLVSACNQDDDDNNGIILCTTVVDNVSGYTNSQMFSSLNSSTTTYNQYRQNLVPFLITTGNSNTDLTTLFNNY